MGILRALGDSVGSSFADQWKEIITAGVFNEHSAVVPGILKNTNNGINGSNRYGTPGVISNGSKIFIPENTAAFIFSQSGIENMITDPGGYEYLDGEKSIFRGDGIGALFSPIKERIGYGGIAPAQKQIAYVNLKEIRDIKFGTRGPQVYNDVFYGVDLEIYSYGSFSIKVVDPEIFIKNFVPANVLNYSFDDPKVRGQILSEFIQSFTVALNSLSTKYRIAHLPSHSNEISQKIAEDSYNAGTWKERFGFEVTKIAIENIEFSDDSRELVKQFSENKMRIKAYEDVSQRSSDIAAQQKIAQGIQDNGLGDSGGMIFGMNLAQGLSVDNGAKNRSKLSLEQQIDALKQLKELVDAGILTEGEFESKKKEIMDL